MLFRVCRGAVRLMIAAQSGSSVDLPYLHQAVRTKRTENHDDRSKSPRAHHKRREASCHGSKATSLQLPPTSLTQEHLPLRCKEWVCVAVALQLMPS